MRTRVIAAILLASAIQLFSQTVPVTTTSNPTVAFVYVGENTTPPKISAFAVQQDGSTQAVSGSPFLGPSYLLASNSGYVFATDNTNLVTYARATNGTLRESSVLRGVPAWAMTLDRSGSSAYVFETNSQEQGAYAEYGVMGTGALAWRATTPYSSNYGSPLLFSADNKFAYGTACSSEIWNVYGFYRGANGVLTAFDPGPTQPPGPTGGASFCPSYSAISAKGYLAILYEVPAAMAGGDWIATYSITSTGGLQYVSSILANAHVQSAGPLRFDPTGTYLVEAGTGTFELNSDGTLTNLGQVNRGAFLDMQWDSAGHAYSIDGTALYIYASNNGVLTLVGSAIPVTQANRLAVVPVSVGCGVAGCGSVSEVANVHTLVPVNPAAAVRRGEP